MLVNHTWTAEVLSRETARGPQILPVLNADQERSVAVTPAWNSR